MPLYLLSLSSRPLLLLHPAHFLARVPTVDPHQVLAWVPEGEVAPSDGVVPLADNAEGVGRSPIATAGGLQVEGGEPEVAIWEGQRTRVVALVAKEVA